MHMIKLKLSLSLRGPVRSMQSGISLIESLVALFILALGILGLTGVQTRTLTETRLTNGRAAAIRMSSDIQERMKLNLEARSVVVAGIPNNPYIVNFGAPAAAPNDCNTVGCNATQLALFDIFQWKSTLAASLPGGDGRIYAIPNDPSQFGVLISWTDNLDQSSTVGTAADQANYVAPFAVTTNVAGTNCPANSACHLTRIRP